MKNRFKKVTKQFLTGGLFILFVFPASTNYELRSFGFGAGGGSLDSTTYSLEGILGEQSASVSSNSYNVRLRVGAQFHDPLIFRLRQALQIRARGITN